MDDSGEEQSSIPPDDPSGVSANARHAVYCACQSLYEDRVAMQASASASVSGEAICRQTPRASGWRRVEGAGLGPPTHTHRTGGRGCRGSRLAEESNSDKFIPSPNWIPRRPSHLVLPLPQVSPPLIPLPLPTITLGADLLPPSHHSHHTLVQCVTHSAHPITRSFPLPFRPFLTAPPRLDLLVRFSEDLTPVHTSAPSLLPHTHTSFATSLSSHKSFCIRSTQDQV